MVIGITGSIASGKSLVTNYLRKKNYKVIDCDKIAHKVLEKKCVIKNIFRIGKENGLCLMKITLLNKWRFPP